MADKRVRSELPILNLVLLLTLSVVEYNEDVLNFFDLKFRTVADQ